MVLQCYVIVLFDGYHFLVLCYSVVYRVILACTLRALFDIIMYIVVRDSDMLECLFLLRGYVMVSFDIVML